MLTKIVFVITLLLLVLIAGIVVRAIMTKQAIFGRPPIPVPYFILAKACVVINMCFLLLKGLNVEMQRIFHPSEIIELIALAILVVGTVVLCISTVALNRELIFGLPSSNDHTLKTGGIYSISRHPFYLGFIFILFSSCLFTANIINIVAFLGAWFIHHIIMIREEQFLLKQYGEEYSRYAEKVNRYITIPG